PLLLPPARHVLPLFFLRTPRPPTSSLFPYTTLFRSDDLESIEESDARFEPLRKRTTNLYQRCENYAARLLRLSDEAFPDALHKRSEERRVGKEGRARWARDPWRREGIQESYVRPRTM